MGKVVQVKPGYIGVYLAATDRRYSAGESATLTSAEYSALDAPTTAALIVTNPSATDPTRPVAINPISLADAVTQANAYTDAHSGASGGLVAANNLSDLANAGTARTNLGLGTAATQATGAFDASGAATTAQGLSLQKSSNLSDVANAGTSRTNLGLGGAAVLAVGTSTGTVAAGDDSRITGAAQKASNLSDLASASTARTNLGLAGAAVLAVGTGAGTVAAGDDSRITGAAQKASNLSDLASASTARTNLGLGGAAVLAVGTSTGQVAAGDDSRIVGAVQTTRTVTAGTGLTGGGDLSANRTLTVAYGTASGTAAQGNDTRIVNARPIQNGMPPTTYYFFPISQGGAGTLATPGNGTLRLAPFYMPVSTTISRIGAEVTAAGNALSVFRIGIYGDTGGIPDALILDAGTIDGTSATVQEITLGTPLVMTAGWYWIGGAAQVAATTQPTMRINNVLDLPLIMPYATTIPGAAQAIQGLQKTGVSGALPSPIGALSGLTASGASFRIFMKVN